MLLAVGAERVIIETPGRRRAVESIIDSARRHLAFPAYRFDDPGVLAAVVRARRRGVRVEVLLSSRAKNGRRDRKRARAALAEAGVDVRTFAAPVKYHAKFLVADGRIALVSSMNLTRRGLDETCDFLVATADPSIVRALGDLFERDREGRTAPRAHPRLVVGPDGTRAAYAALLTGARHSIQIIDHKLSDPAILDLLARKVRDGVRVDIVGRRRAGRRAHGKLVIVDGATAVLGSVALTPASLDARRELGIVLREPRSVAPLVRYFHSLRPTSQPAWNRTPGLLACEAV